MNGHSRRWSTESTLVTGALVVGALLAGAVVGGLIAVAAGSGLDCPGGNSGGCAPSWLVSTVAGTVFGMAVAGLPWLVRKVRPARPHRQRVVVACCVTGAGGFVAVLAGFATLLGAPAVAAVCAGAVLASGLLLIPRDVATAVGLCLVAGCAAWLVRQELAAVLLLAPAMLLWLAAGLILIGTPNLGDARPRAGHRMPEVAGRAASRVGRVLRHPVRATAVTK